MSHFQVRRASGESPVHEGAGASNAAALKKRYRIYKAAVLGCSMLPLGWWVLCAFGLFGLSLGANPVEYLLESCGKTALNLLMITLMVTPVRILTGWTQVVRVRRMLGLCAFFYAVLHFVVYLTLDRGLEFDTILTDIAKRPYITIGFTALLLLIPLAITSTDKMMRRMGKRWQTLHLLTYPVMILVIWHFFWQVKADVREPLIYAGVLALLFAIRIFKRPIAAFRSKF